MHFTRAFLFFLACVCFLGVTGCDLSKYERINIGLSDGSVMDVACTPEILGERCDGRDNDCDGLTDDDDPDIVQQTGSDPSNCGACYHVCSLPNVMIHGCENGECTIAACTPGYVDNNGDPDDGCEDDCIPTSSFDFCDGIDNNCDGRTDEDFDLMNDVHNCGECGYSCILEHGHSTVASFACVQGQCRIAVCTTHRYDINEDLSDGCEYYCVQDSPVELCDGSDNDCNGHVDDNPQDAPTCKQQGVCAGTQPVCTVAGVWECDYAANATTHGWTYESPETAASLCDGMDNDCDGHTDEGFNVGLPCFAGSGVCRTQGQYVCTGDMSGTECNAVPDMTQADVEVCDGLDNDCDGDVDEVDPSDPDFDQYGSFVYISSGNFTIFAHEASRPSATSGFAGFGDEGKPCSVPNKMPWSNITAIDEDISGDAEAREVCQRLGAGWDLCTVTNWYTACAGASSQAFPYGTTYQANSCNGYDFGLANGGVGPRATAVLNLCYRTQGVNPFGNARVYDMSGNLKEWVWTGTGYEVRGGAYNNISQSGQAPALQCDGTSPMPPGTEVHLPSIGFRCCYSGNLFN